MNDSIYNKYINWCIPIDGMIYLQCPHCKGGVEIKENEVNCLIFRHGIFKHNGEQVSPHLPKEECDNLVIEKKIYGCCRPFKLEKIEAKWYIFECDYI